MKIQTSSGLIITALVLLLATANAKVNILILLFSNICLIKLIINI